jgi:hypothetical protein
MAVLLPFGLVIALLGFWRVLQPTSGPFSSASARPTTAPDVTTSVSVVVGGDPSHLTDPQRRALERNLAAQQPNPLVTSIRRIVGPEMSEDTLEELARKVNLLCAGSTTVQAQTHLIEDGMHPASAKAIIKAACASP